MNEHEKIKELIKFLKENNIGLSSEEITGDYVKSFNPSISLRQYQIDALNEVARQFDNDSKRQFLLEMATGTGKTLLCAALILRFLKSNNAQRVLFIVDRIELAKQTMEEFGVILRDYGPVIYKNARKHPAELLGSSVVVATIQSLMVDRRFFVTEIRRESAHEAEAI